MNKQNTIVIYHRADFDGLFCREVARKFLALREEGLANTFFFGWDYNDPEPALKDLTEETQLYIMDLSVPSLMNHPKLIWIDHHRSAIEQYPKTIPGYRIEGVAACRLAWQWFLSATYKPIGATSEKQKHRFEEWRRLHLPSIEDYGAQIKDANGKVVRRTAYRISEPYALRMIGEYDVWDRRDENSVILQSGLKATKLLGYHFEGLLDETVNDTLQIPENEIMANAICQVGRPVFDAKQEENRSVIKELGFTLKWRGLTFLACNHGRFNSFLFEDALKPEHDACYGFKWLNNGWYVSLYHAPGKEHIDLSVIAKEEGRKLDPATGKPFGGGGHPGACGFRAASLPFFPKMADDKLGDIDVVHNSVNVLMQEGCFQFLNQWLEAQTALLSYGGLTVDAALSVLTATLLAKSKLPARKEFYAACVTACKSSAEPEDLLAGLE